MTTWAELAADKEFRRALRARRRAGMMRRLRRHCGGGLAVAGGEALLTRSAEARLGTREIPVEAITGTVEPNRAAQFDADFRPAPTTRARWQRIWVAMQHGTPLPPITVVRVRDGYAIRDGHHRVSVAKWSGAATIAAVVAG
jgi:hypothetical protein